MITKVNYQLYALDYLEGNLSDSERKSFEGFLDKNPEIALEIEHVQLTPLVAHNVIYPDKRFLIRKESQRIAYLPLFRKVAILLIGVSALGFLFLMTQKKELLPASVELVETNTNATSNEEKQSTKSIIEVNPMSVAEKIVKDSKDGASHRLAVREHKQTINANDFRVPSYTKDANILDNGIANNDKISEYVKPLKNVTQVQNESSTKKILLTTNTINPKYLEAKSNQKKQRTYLYYRRVDRITPSDSDAIVLGKRNSRLKLKIHKTSFRNLKNNFVPETVASINRK